MKRVSFFLPSVVCVAAASAACLAPESGAGPASVTVSTPLAGPSYGSTIALTDDDQRLVVSNEEPGTVSVFSVDAKASPPAVEKIAEVAVGEEPSQIVLHPSGDTAFVLTRKSQELVRIDGLASAPKKVAVAKVGSEPTGVALSPLGTTAYVANWVDGTISVVETATMKVKETIDLNAPLVGSGLLGNIEPRPALSHPRSVAVTNDRDGDESDETLWVSEFYALQKTPLEADGSNADTAKVALLYRVPLATRTPAVVEIPPMTDMGFRDHNGNVAGCFPNQLLSLTLHDDRVFVTSVCASPKGPTGPFTGPAPAVCTTDTECPGALPGSCSAGKCTTNCVADEQCGKNEGKCANFVCAPNTADVKTTSAPALTVVNAKTGEVQGTVNLARSFVDGYTAAGTPDDANRRMPLLPFGVEFEPGTSFAYLAANGADALFRVELGAPDQGSLVVNAGDPKAMFVDMTSPVLDARRVGKLPTGVAITHRTSAKGAAEPAPRYAFVSNMATRNVTVVDLQEQAIAGMNDGAPVIVSSTDTPSPEVQERMEGRYFFNSGVGRWSLKGQSWVSCQSCHVDGLSDNVTWFFPRGPRQPQSLDGTYNKNNPDDIRANNWTAIQDEIADHEMGAIRGTAAGVGAIVSDVGMKNDARIAIDKLGHAGLSGSAFAAADPKNPAALPNACVKDDWTAVRQYVRSIRSPKRPSQLAVEQIERGRAAFEEGKCQGCHGGDKWTLSRVFYAPDASNKVNNALKTTRWTDAVTSSGFPAALLPTAVPEAQTMRYNGKAVGDMDSLTCLLRNVGTFGVAEPEVGVVEVRKDMKTASQGNEETGRGYNPPSLLGLSMGAPYLHAGQARTLEGLFSSRFSSHHQALAPGYLEDGSERSAKLRDLIVFLLSIDADAKPVPTPALGPEGGDFCTAPAP